MFECTCYTPVNHNIGIEPKAIFDLAEKLSTEIIDILPEAKSVGTHHYEYNKYKICLCDFSKIQLIHGIDALSEIKDIYLRTK